VDIDLKSKDQNGGVLGMHHDDGSLGNDYEKTVFIGNLPWVLNEEDLRKHFSKMGEMLNVRIIRDGRTFIGKGFGYIMFANKDDMKKAILEMNGSMFKGRELRVKKAVEAKRLEKKQ
jgi:nucleolar protein 12